MVLVVNFMKKTPGMVMGGGGWLYLLCKGLMEIWLLIEGAYTLGGWRCSLSEFFGSVLHVRG